ncbi:MAG: Ser/Thr protein kinase RdoA (MazF antagonist) [Bacteroidia bacterium]|jgi:Ser/Thr protein kinase RdoA (MazF antagonist)
MTRIEPVLKSYFPERTLKSVNQLSGGLINQTFRVALDDDQTFIAQKINTSVFENVAKVHSNISVLAEYLSKSGYRFEFPAPIKNESGTDSIEIGEETWRVLPFVKDTYSIHQAASKKMAFNAGACLGHFHSCLVNFPVEKLKLNLPDFHSGEFRIKQLEEAISKSNLGELEFVKQVKPEFDILRKWDQINANVPTRVAHFDPKIENFLFKNGTDEVAALIDLDTMMSGSILSDIGDMIRSFCDEELKFRDVLIEGYLSEMKERLTEVETRFLKFSGSALSLMQAVRFLTDHLNGDMYYQTEYEGQNLERAEQQFALYQQLHS